MDEKDTYYGRPSDQQENSDQVKSDSLYSYSYINKDSQQAYQGEAFQEEKPQEENHGLSSKKKKEKTGKGSFKQGLAKCVAYALVFGLISGGCFAGVVKATGTNTSTAKISYGTTTGGKVSSTATNSATTVTDVSQIVENVMPSIVAITNTQETTVQSFFGMDQTYETPTAGSGIIIAQDDNQLLIATNNHVVADSTDIKVSFIDDQSVAATIKGTDPGSDLAVLSVKLSDIPEKTLSAIKVAVMGESDNLKVGESAIAIGNALGYGQSVTTGVISAVNRSVTIDNTTNSLIQTDAAINPGNSGGALLNLKGEVIGINSAKYSDTDVEGIGYAIPITTAEPIIENLISRQEVNSSERAYLGIYGVDVSSDVAKVYNMPEGVYVRETVENAAAAQAGIKAGDIITKFDKTKISSMEELQDVLQYYKAGTQVTITLQRGGTKGYEEKTVKVTLSNAKDAQTVTPNN